MKVFVVVVEPTSRVARTRRHICWSQCGPVGSRVGGASGILRGFVRFPVLRHRLSRCERNTAGGAAAARKYQEKVQKYERTAYNQRRSLVLRTEFVTLVWETFGFFDTKSHSLLRLVSSIPSRTRCLDHVTNYGLSFRNCLKSVVVGSDKLGALKRL